jgi:hypothetical protein
MSNHSASHFQQTGGAPPAPDPSPPGSNHSSPAVNPPGPGQASQSDASQSQFDDNEPTDGPPEVLLLSLRRHLPPIEVAHRLLHAYFSRGTWLVRGPTRKQLLEIIVPALYSPTAHADAEAAAKVSHAHAGNCGAHAHAVLFGVFAVSHLVAPEGPQTAECDAWIRRAQAALVVRSVFDGPSLLTLQALHVLGVIMLMRQDGRDELAWSYQALASHLSITMGLRVFFL